MSDSEEEQVVQEVIPEHTIRYKDMDPKLIKEVVKKAEELFQDPDQNLENNIAVKLVAWIKTQPAFKVGDGQWQCVIGNNFGCSLTFDAHVLVFFDLLSVRKSILLFKSG